MGDQSTCILRKIPSAGGTPVDLSTGLGAGHCGGASWRPTTP
jgi:hypothetical protein